MHEVSIADAIVATAERHAGGRRVALVEVKVGHLRQVVPSALSFAWELVAAGTALEGAELQIDDVPVRVACRACGAESEAPEFPLACAGCRGVDVDVVAGNELYVEALELEDEPEPVSAARR
jgi:hydrogenase nickel incorporation protein HypA/HybF